MKRILYASAVLFVLMAVYTAVRIAGPPQGSCNCSDDMDHQLAEAASKYRTIHPDELTTTVLLEIVSINAQERTLTIRVTPTFFAQFDGIQETNLKYSWSAEDDKGHNVYEEAGGDVYTGEPKLRKEFITEEVTIGFASSAGSVDVSYPLADVLDHTVDGEAAPPKVVTLPVLGSVQSFPNDSYSADLTLLINVPSNIRVRVDDAVKTLSDYVAFGVVSDPRLVDWSLGSTGVAEPEPVEGKDLEFLAAFGSISLTRPPSYWLFIYCISLCPVLIGLSVAIQHFARRKSMSVEGGGYAELAAALLALLALRQVLVPGDIPGLLRLDKILGVELVALVALATVLLPRPSIESPRVSRGRDPDHGTSMRASATPNDTPMASTSKLQSKVEGAAKDKTPTPPSRPNVYTKVRRRSRNRRSGK